MFQGYPGNQLLKQVRDFNCDILKENAIQFC